MRKKNYFLEIKQLEPIETSRIKMNAIGTNDTQSPSYKCTKCDKQYQIYSSYFSHRKTHDQPSEIFPECGVAFQTKAGLFRHYYNTHRVTKAPPVMQHTTNRMTPLAQRMGTLY